MRLEVGERVSQIGGLGDGLRGDGKEGWRTDIFLELLI